MISPLDYILIKKRLAEIDKIIHFAQVDHVVNRYFKYSGLFRSNGALFFKLTYNEIMMLISKVKDYNPYIVPLLIKSKYDNLYDERNKLRRLLNDPN